MRPPFDSVYLDCAHALRKRSTCSRGKVGVVITRGTVPIAMGYNGSLPGGPHCDDVGCDVEANVHGAGCTRTVHAEANAVAHAARLGIAVDGCTMYCTHSPCKACAQLVVSAGIRRYVYSTPYRDETGLHILYENGVDVHVA